MVTGLLPWLGPAFALLAAAGLTIGRRVIGGRAVTALAAGGAGALIGSGALGIPGVDIFPDGDDMRRRRRRRRALSQGDRDDIAFIAATISQSAAGKFAVMLATRAR